MKTKVVLGFIFIGFVCGVLFVPGSYSRNLRDDEQLIWVGIGAFKDGFYDIAEKQFTAFVSTYPKHDKVFEIYYLLGRTLFIKGNLKEAKKVFSKIINEGTHFENTDYALLGMAELEMKLGNQGEAMKLLLTLIQKFPKFEQIDYSYYLLGLLQLGPNQLTAAESTFKNVSQYSNNNQLVGCSLFWLGVRSFRQKQYETASGYFQTLWEKPGSIPPEYLKYALFWLGESQLKLGRIDEAKHHYHTFCDRFKNDPLLPEAYWRTGFANTNWGISRIP